MSFRQMEYLVTVVEEGSFTAAAERLGVTQPTLSHQIRALERDVGVPLLERLPGRVLLTPMGREYLPHAVAALRSARLAAGEGAGRAGPARLRIATLYSIALGVVPPAVRAWRAADPGAEVEVAEFASVSALEGHVASGGADLGIGPRPTRWSGPLYELGEEELVLVLPPGDPLADYPHVPLRALSDRPWVLYDADNALAPLVAAACAEAGFEPRAAVRTHHSATALQLAAAGLGPALVPSGVLDPALPVTPTHPTPPIRRHLAAFMTDPPSPSTARFLTFLQNPAS
ncbi:LysR family transcriptional regulator [Actinocorallia aurea]